MQVMKVRWNQPSSPKRCKRNDQEIKSSAIIQAEELQSKLDLRYPSFIKPLLKSHVTGGFWMGFSAPFCRKHLPPKDTFITLETETKKTYRVNYLAKKIGLSAGWRGFALSERLSVGDVIVFHLVSATTFKVYIMKENNSTRVDGARFPLNSETQKEQTDLCTLIGRSKGKDFLEVDQGTMPPPGDSGSNTIINSSRASHGISIHEETNVNLEAVSTFDNFSIIIDKLLKDYKLPQHIKWNYYKLCCSQKSLLHDNLPESMNHIMVGGIIIETVTIADVLRQCSLTTSKDKFDAWNKTLNALELLGMNFEFLREKMNSLQAMVLDQGIVSSKQEHAELCSKNARSEDEIKTLMSKLTEIRKEHSRRAVDIEHLKLQIKNHELKFQELVNAPW